LHWQVLWFVYPNEIIGKIGCRIHPVPGREPRAPTGTSFIFGMNYVCAVDLFVVI
jgi:hypothetical protein